MKKTLAAIAAATVLLGLNACSSPTSSGGEPPVAGPSSSSSPATPSGSESPAETTAPDGQGTPVTITAGDRTFRATINDSQVSKDFLAPLPATLTWNRNAGIEYITELDEPMTETGPFYADVQAGDIVYYNPMDSITIIYAPTSSVPTLTKMGEITSDLAAFENLPDSVEMQITRQ